MNVFPSFEYQCSYFWNSLQSKLRWLWIKFFQKSTLESFKFCYEYLENTRSIIQVKGNIFRWKMPPALPNGFVKVGNYSNAKLFMWNTSNFKSTPPLFFLLYSKTSLGYSSFLTFLCIRFSLNGLSCCIFYVHIFVYM